MRVNVMEYFKPGEKMRMMCYSVMTQAYRYTGMPVSLLNNTFSIFLLCKNDKISVV